MGFIIFFKKLFRIPLSVEETVYDHKGPVTIAIPKPVPISPVIEPPKSPIYEPPVLPKPAMEATCPAPGVFGAVDLSQPVTQHFLDVARYLGVKTIIRYYDYPGSPTLPGKIPTLAELALIKKNGFQFCAVFQHNNSKLASFTKERGRKDAGKVLELAALWKQPKGSGVYFGVDFDPDKHELISVMDYASEFSEIIKAAGFRVGAYGSGLTMETLLAVGYIELAWLSMSTGFQNTKKFSESGRWNLKQVLDRNCGGINIDFDFVNNAKPDFGQWAL